MKFRYLCIAGVIIAQAVGITLGYNNDPSVVGVVKGMYVTLMFLMLVAVNILIIGKLAGKL